MNLQEWREGRGSNDLNQALAEAKKTRADLKLKMIQDWAKEVSETKRLSDLLDEARTDEAN